MPSHKRMRLFGKREEAAVPPPIPVEATELPLSPNRVIPLSDEHQRLLAQPIDTRVERILSELTQQRAASDSPWDIDRIIPFPVAPSAACSSESLEAIV